MVLSFFNACQAGHVECFFDLARLECSSHSRRTVGIGHGNSGRSGVCCLCRRHPEFYKRKRSDVEQPNFHALEHRP